MDRNSIIGFLLLIALLIGYVTYNQHAQKQYLEQKTADSIAYAKAHPRPVVDSSKAIKEMAAANSVSDSLRKTMPPAYFGKKEVITLENKNLALQFTTKGAYPVSAMVKNFQTYKHQPLYLFNGAGNQLSAILPINNGAVATTDLYFTPIIRQDPNGDKSVDFAADLGSGKKVDIVYTLPADDYMMQCSIHLTGMPANNLPLTWQTEGLSTERDVMLERMYSQVYYRYMDKSQDYMTIRGDEKKSLSQSAQWIGLRKQYFNSILVSDDGFNKIDIVANTKLPDSNIAVKDKTTMEVPLKAGNDETVALKWYIGPNDYRVLKNYKMDMEEMVPMGYGIMAFVKYINKWLLLPLFFFLTGLIGNYGVIIILMTAFIRLILSFFTYKSYLSAAKMRVLKPELDELRAKLGGDQQKFSMEQMKLYRSAGVNPLGGCLPMLFQLPILFALYYLFPSLIEFRQKSFLWVGDLSTYDSIAHLPFSIPFYGDHVSLFTLLMTASSIFLAVYNQNTTAQDMSGSMAMMKYMPYIMPVVFLGIFNKMAAALTFYYLVSNTVSILQQIVIKKYFINEQQIHAQLQENKNKPATPSKWAARMEELQKTQAERMKQQQKGLKK